MCPRGPQKVSGDARFEFPDIRSAFSGDGRKSLGGADSAAESKVNITLMRTVRIPLLL